MRYEGSESRFLEVGGRARETVLIQVGFAQEEFDFLFFPFFCW